MKDIVVCNQKEVNLEEINRGDIRDSNIRGLLEQIEELSDVIDRSLHDLRSLLFEIPDHSLPDKLTPIETIGTVDMTLKGRLLATVSNLQDSATLIDSMGSACDRHLGDIKLVRY